MMALLLGAATAERAEAVQTQRFTTDQHGDFVLIGNTVGFDCVAGLPDPTVGTFNRAVCGANTADSGPDALWRSDSPAPGQAESNQNITPAQARSTAVLNLPSGATVVYARLYWASEVLAGAQPGTSVLFERPGALMKTVNADANRGTSFVDATTRFYQSTADVTRDVQQYGPGPYRVGGMATVDPRGRNDANYFIAWHMVVFYQLASEPTRNLTLFDGFDQVVTGRPQSVLTQGLVVPTTGADAKLGVVAYDGDGGTTGDLVRWNGTVLTNAQNPANDFFNGTRSRAGTPVSVVGDLPQLTGVPRSMMGVDLDVIDTTAQIKTTDTQVLVTADTSGDNYFLGTMVTSVATRMPVFSQTTKQLVNLSRTTGGVLAGDLIEYTISLKNTGSDTGVNVKVTDALPLSVSYVPGTIEVVAGNNTGKKTDQAGDDQADYDAVQRAIVVRVGAGADAVMGGKILADEPDTVIKFQVRINPAAAVVIDNQAVVSAQGEAALAQGGTATHTWLSGDGVNLAVPTQIVLQCGNNADCPVAAPICDTAAAPARCVCNADSDCRAKQVCDTTGSRSCVQCVAGKTANCVAASVGSLCVAASSLCGCITNADCGGRACNPATNQCPQTTSNVGVSIGLPSGTTSLPAGSSVVYTVTVTNKGTTAIIGADISDRTPAGVTGAMWTCAGSGGASCPIQSGSGAIAATVDLPIAGRLVYTVTVPVPAISQGSSFTYVVTATLSPGFIDSDPRDNIAVSSTPIMGPDLGISVETGEVGSDGGVTYTFHVTNLGPGSAPGATLRYLIPQNATVGTVSAGNGWVCTTMTGVVECSLGITTPVGELPPVSISVTAGSDALSIPLSAMVEASNLGATLTDPNPGNNQISGTTELSSLYLRGGGIGCGVSGKSASGVAPGAPHQRGSQAATLGVLAILALMLTTGLRGLRQRRRSPGMRVD